MKGKITRILHMRGFGFIKKDNEDEELYFHWSKTLDDFYYLKEGDEVEFEEEETQKGTQAVNVTSLF